MNESIIFDTAFEKHNIFSLQLLLYIGITEGHWKQRNPAQKSSITNNK